MGDRTIVVTGATFPEEVARELEAGGFRIKTVPGDLDEAGVVQSLQGAWGYLLGGSERMSKNAWAQLPDLAVACFLGTGYSSFMELPDGKSPTRFTYTPHANAEAVAEFSIAQMIDLVRGITRAVSGIRAGRWSEEATPSMIGARLGVAGMGHIGREVARMAHGAFGAQVFYWNRTRRPELDALPYTPVNTLTDLFEAADLVSVNFAYEPGVNDGVISRTQLAALGTDGFLVNTARAALLDPAALRTALSENWIAGASMDGYYIEPTPAPADDIYGLLAFIPHKLLVTPHNAYLSRQAIRKMAEMAVENVLAVARGEDPPYQAAAVGLSPSVRAEETAYG
jgi:phosphoglycerate dehydrogenase-like enzyme